MSEQGSFATIFQEFVDAHGLQETLKAFHQVKEILPQIGTIVTCLSKDIRKERAFRLV
jgi:hypothetical protein